MGRCQHRKLQHDPSTATPRLGHRRGARHAVAAEAGMTHYRSLLDHTVLGAWDLQKDGKAVDVPVTIGAVEQVEFFDPKTTKPTKKLCLRIKERPERLLV